MLEIVAQDYIKALQEERLRHPRGIIARTIQDSNSDLFISLNETQVEDLFIEFGYLLMNEAEFRESDLAIKSFIEQFPYKQVFMAIDNKDESQAEFETNTFIQLFRLETLNTGKYLLTQEIVDYLEDENLEFIEAETLGQNERPDIRLIAENQDRQRIEQLFSSNTEGLYIPTGEPTLRPLAELDTSSSTIQRTTTEADITERLESSSINEGMMTVMTESAREQRRQEEEGTRPEGSEQQSDSITLIEKQRQALEEQRLRLLADANVQPQPEQQEETTSQNMTSSFLKRGLAAAYAGAGVTVLGIPLLDILEII